MPAKRPTPSGEVAWTDKLRGKIFASRAIPNPLHLRGTVHGGPCWVPDDVPYPYDADAAWKKALDRTWSLAEWARPPNSIPVGYANATPELATIARAALDAFGTRLDTLDATTEAAMMVLGLRPSWTALPLWIAMHGVAFATRAMCTAARWRNNEGATGKHREQGLHLIEDGHCAGREVYEHATGWRLLRGVLALADEHSYTDARAIADAARHALPADQKAAIAFAFPDEPWTKDAVDAHLAAPSDAAAEPRMMMLATAERSDAIRLARAGYSANEPFVLTMLAKHGVHGVEIIAAAFAAPGPANRLGDLANALAMIRTREALEAFLPMLGINAVKAPLARAFKAQPELGKKLLAKPAMKADKAGSAATALLAKL
jgi:hypothetical protein